MQSKKAVQICIWVLFIVYLFSFLFTTSNDFSQDLGRHLKLGEIIVRTHSIPKTNLFSYTNSSFPFINHHWLSEVIFFLSQKWMGLSSLIILKACVISLAIIIASLASRSMWAFAIGVFLSPLILERADIRPEIFGFLFFSLLLLQIKRLKRGGNVFFLLPLIFLFWVNTHISFVFGLLLLSIIFFVADKNRQNSAILVLSIVCLFINPNGASGVFAPLTIFNNYGYPIVENQNMFFLFGRTSDIFIREYFLLLPFIFICIYLLLKQKEYVGSCILTIFTALALYQVRHLPFFVLTALVFIPDVFKKIPVHLSQTIRFLMQYALIFLLFCGIFFFGSNLFFEIFDINKSFGVGFDLEDRGVIKYLEQNQKKGNIFNNFDIGSYLSFGLYPKQKVFVDGRPEAYPASFFQDVYIPIEEDQKKQDTYFKKFNIHTVVISYTDQTPWAQTFLKRIIHDNTWSLVFIDSFFAVFTDEKGVIDVRNTDEFVQQIEKETDFFRMARYIYFLEAMEEKNKFLYLYKKINILRPHSCSLIRMRKTQNDAPWCF